MAESSDSRTGRVIRPTIQLSPRKSRRNMKKRLRRNIRRFKRSPFPLFGLPPSWTGHRWLAASSGAGGPGQPGTVESLSLGHSPSMRDEMRLIVTSEAPGLAQGHTELQVIAEILWRDGAVNVDEAFERYHAELGAAHDRDVERPVESQAVIVVDGSPTQFRVLRRSDSWLAAAELPTVWIAVEGRSFDIDDVELVTVTDLKPYIEGTRAFLLSAAGSAARSKGATPRRT